ncbi:MULTISPECIES: DUF2513 domain-containing protein [unclassified Pseudodesulfovibrio]|uniref:DUF2513 domain-containing protein n=1 Tax=unclassified Pseudodesulfovibrio TaxID=2661612 RepID=UPI000FEB83B0|nr:MULTISPECIES: DUF2513 domain-containing protein [unclassified Pseudodesulfovibrio]MCJ2165600.1 DUF2513 domain-containing protein [Pseudodesulfovibrio sp. S3-i]RWU03008.1 DUF2513 domain-containing protein [Pseudodesulfovibrio sp. S3]
MKRNMDLVRSLLFELEEHPDGYSPDNIEVDGYSEEEVGYHFLLMVEAGLIEGEEISDLGSSSPSAMPIRLTWYGHDFLDASRDSKRWKKAQGIFAKLGGVTMDVAVKILTDLMSQQVANLMK